MIAVVVLSWSVLVLSVALVCFFQLFYLYQSLRIRASDLPAASASTLPQTACPGDRITVLIPVFNDADALRRCLQAIAANDLKYCAKVVVILDRCTDESEEVARSSADDFALADVSLAVEKLPEGLTGKVAAIMHGGQMVDSEVVLLLDADIILESTALEELISFHRHSRLPFSSCLIFPLQQRHRSRRRQLESHVICNNRLYRQAVLQRVRSQFGLSNFPGGLQLVHFKQYCDLLAEGFLEDLAATYQFLAEGGKLAILPKVLAYEAERQTIGGLFLQRTRWTIGAIRHIPIQMRTARARTSFTEKTIVNSYHVMWELQYYVMVVAAGACWWRTAALWPLLLLPYTLYVLQISRSAYLARQHYKNSFGGVIAHCAIYPWVITAALFSALYLLAVKRRWYFESLALFRRS